MSGGLLKLRIDNPSATYTYTIGSGGSAGTAGSGAAAVAGAKGASGVIYVEEFYG